MAACLVGGRNILHEASARDRVQAGRSIFVWRAVVNALLLLLAQAPSVAQATGGPRREGPPRPAS